MTKGLLSGTLNYTKQNSTMKQFPLHYTLSLWSISIVSSENMSKHCNGLGMVWVPMWQPTLRKHSINRFMKCLHGQNMSEREKGQQEEQEIEVSYGEKGEVNIYS